MKKKKIIRKKNKLEELWLKFSDRGKYKQYKVDLKEHEMSIVIGSFLARVEDHKKANIVDSLSSRNFINVVHSGHLGDVIYSLPTIKKIQQLSQKQVNFYLKLNQSFINPTNHKHPLGNVMINENMAEMLIPLINSQSYINTCGAYSGETIDIDLDNFRKAGLLLDRGHIGRWCGYITGVNPDLHKRWLQVEPNQSYSECIVIARSERYRNPHIDYSFLSAYKNVAFVGVRAEYENIKSFIPHIHWVQVKDFVELASIISGCKIFIGNQSFPFSLAEGLKVTRILETYMLAPNVIPEGDKGYDFVFQSHFEWLVERLNEGREV